jgi:hypothetical protein
LQSKSLVDIIQLECISQSSSVLRITNGPLTGKIWIKDGELIDAETAELNGEAAFLKILSWRAGGFESLPPDPARPRAIVKSYNGLLLEGAQAMDESVAADGAAVNGASPLARLSQIDGLEFVLKIADGKQEARGLEDPKGMADWSHKTMERFQSLGDHLRVGQLEQLEGRGPRRHVTLTQQGPSEFCVGWKPSMGTDQTRDLKKKVLELWAS